MSQSRKPNDPSLGMDRAITRRDFLDGVAQGVTGVAAGSWAGAAGAQAAAAAAPPTVGAEAEAAAAADAPPRLQGLRGFDQAAMDAGHALRDGHTLGAVVDIPEYHDLVVVGAGLSGLAAAWFYRQQRPGAKVLVLDGCDDFGGHARRVEFRVDGRQLLVCGGSQELWYLNTFAPESLRMLEAIGIDRERYARQRQADADPLAARGLRPATFFDAESFGVDRLVVGAPPLRDATPERLRAYYDTTPLPEPVKQGLVRLYTDRSDPLPGLSLDEKVRRLRSISFTGYLADVLRLPPEAVAFVAAGWGNDNDNSSAGFDTTSAWVVSRSNPSLFAGLGLPRADRRSNVVADPGEMIQFPDGNAGVARLLVRHLVPDALPGRSAEDSIAAELRYDRLDRPGQPVRIRLASTVARVVHQGDPASAREVAVSYLRDGRAERVRAGAVVMACFNAIVPHLMPELPEAQKAALRQSVRKAQLRSFVAVRNWRAFDRLGARSIGSRGLYFSYTAPWFMPEWGGAYRNARTPDEPAIVYMNLARHVLDLAGSKLPPRERWRAARATLAALNFETLEREIRSQLQRLLGPGGFDAARDIAGITACRWAHGYAGGSNELYDPDWSGRSDAPWVLGRQRFGRVAIANSDAAATSLANAAFAQAHRAVLELVNDIDRPVYDFRWSERDSAS